jgi:hypothetical protein
MKKLPEKFKLKWIKALRSGKFKQAKGVLRRGEGYCCLGVACVAADIKDVPRSPVISLIGEKFENVPNVIRGGCSTNYVVERLVEMNDSGVSFSEIADWIEKRL